METPRKVAERVETIFRHEQEFAKGRIVRDSLRRPNCLVCWNDYIRVAASGWLRFLGSLELPPLQRAIIFDPFPFGLLDTIVALEAILLASFILMRQTSQSRRADECDHLMLQILLLPKREVSGVVRMGQQTASHFGLQSISKDDEIMEMAQPTPIDKVAQTIQEKLFTDQQE